MVTAVTFEPGQVKPKYYRIAICCCCAKNAALRIKSKDWLAGNWDNVERHVYQRLLFQ
jgi:hypothetical protein